MNTPTKPMAVTRETDNGFTRVSADLGICPVTHNRETESTGLVWVLVKDGSTTSHFPLHPVWARNLAHDLQAAADETDAIVRSLSAGDDPDDEPYEPYEPDEIQRDAIAEEMRRLGFKPHMTGGGCDAYLYEVNPEADDGPHFLVTEDDDAAIPETWDQAVAIGYYASSESYEIEIVEHESIAVLIQLLRCGKGHPRWLGARLQEGFNAREEQGNDD